MLAKDIMTTDVITVSPDEKVDQVARLLLDHRISASPVVDQEGRMLGIVSDADLVRRAECGGKRSWWLALLADKTAHFTRDLGTRARDVMTRNVATIDDETPIADIARILEGKGITRVPVLRNGQLVGIVSRADVLRALGAIEPRYETLPSANDRQIRASILDLIKHNTSTSLQAVSVIVVNSAVYLWGTAETQSDKDAIRIAAENVVGGEKVHNFLNTLPEIMRAV